LSRKAEIKDGVKKSVD